MSAWNQDAMSVLHTFGFPRTCMYNMDPACCAQYVAVVKSLQLQASRTLAAAELSEAALLGGWWSCALCKAGEVGIIAANVALIGAIIVATGGTGAPVVAALEESASVVAIAAATGVSVARVAQLAAAVFATSGFSSFVGDFAEALCREGGFCS
jgi:hypothetical protein